MYHNSTMELHCLGCHDSQVPWANKYNITIAVSLAVLIEFNWGLSTLSVIHWSWKQTYLNDICWGAEKIYALGFGYLVACPPVDIKEFNWVWQSGPKPIQSRDDQPKNPQVLYLSHEELEIASSITYPRKSKSSDSFYPIESHMQWCWI